MLKFKFFPVIILVFSLLLPHISLANSSFWGGGSAESRPPSVSSGPKAQVAMIIFSGLGGAVLGLSTLSFYDRPQDHLANIAVGAALGVITGTVYVTFKTATEPYRYRSSKFYNRSINQRENYDQWASYKTPTLVNLSWSF